MTMAAWATSHPAIPLTPADIRAAIYAARHGCRRDELAAYAALHPGTAAIDATGGDMSSAAYEALHPAVGASGSTRGDMSPADLNHRAR